MACFFLNHNNVCFVFVSLVPQYVCASVFMGTRVLLTCSHQGQASESQPGMCHTSPPSRQLDTHTFPLHHTAGSPNLGGDGGGRQMDRAGRKQKIKCKGRAEETGALSRKWGRAPSESVKVVGENYMKWINSILREFRCMS